MSSLRIRILKYLKSNISWDFQRDNYLYGKTNMQLAKALKASPAQVSSITCRLTKAGKIQRHYDTTGFGQPRYVYYL